MSAKQGVTSSQSAGPKFGLFPIPSLLVATRTFLPASPHPHLIMTPYFLWADLVTRIQDHLLRKGPRQARARGGGSREEDGGEARLSWAPERGWVQLCAQQWRSLEEGVYAHLQRYVWVCVSVQHECVCLSAAVGRLAVPREREW